MNRNGFHVTHSIDVTSIFHTDPIVSCFWLECSWSPLVSCQINKWGNMSWLASTRRIGFMVHCYCDRCKISEHCIKIKFMWKYLLERWKGRETDALYPSKNISKITPVYAMYSSFDAVNTNRNKVHKKVGTIFVEWREPTNKSVSRRWLVMHHRSDDALVARPLSGTILKLCEATLNGWVLALSPLNAGKSWVFYLSQLQSSFPQSIFTRTLLPSPICRLAIM